MAGSLGCQSVAVCASPARLVTFKRVKRSSCTRDESQARQSPPRWWPTESTSTLSSPPPHLISFRPPTHPSSSPSSSSTPPITWILPSIQKLSPQLTIAGTFSAPTDRGPGTAIAVALPSPPSAQCCINPSEPCTKRNHLKPSPVFIVRFLCRRLDVSLVQTAPAANLDHPGTRW